MRIFIRPYKQSSKSALRLARGIGAKVFRLQNSKYKPRDTDVIINWGNKSPAPAEWSYKTVLNHPLTMTRDKLHFYKTHFDLVPPFSESYQWAEEFLTKKGNPKIVCRSILSGMKGAGITIVSDVKDLIESKVYMKYIKKKEEYRVHFFLGNVEFIQQKKKRKEFENPNYQIRNHDNGFVYCHKDVTVPEEVWRIIEEFLYVTDLDFGAIDIVYNKKNNKAYILEVNTAPGLSGNKTLQVYVENIKKVIDEYVY